MSSTDAEAGTKEQALDAYRAMRRIRAFEEHAARLYADGEIPGFCHLSIGQEATAVGAGLALADGDVITSTHRGHGHVIARGADILGMFAELLGREDGLCHGRGGSMHIADVESGILGANGIVGAGLPIALGAAVTFRRRGQDAVALAFFGDGAVAQGAFHESLNLAALWRLPVVFLCEDNKYAEFTPSSAQHPVPIVQRAQAYGMPGRVVDGNDVAGVRDGVAEAAARARNGDGPTLIVAESYRWRGHYEGDGLAYRPDGEAESAQDRDPLLASRFKVDQTALTLIDAEVRQEVDEALRAALAAPEPEPATLSRFSIRPRVAPSQLKPAEPPAKEVRYAHALNNALRDALHEDERTFVAGIDVGQGQGVFRVTRDLFEEFGPDRVLDTPISEMALMGLAVGAAMNGDRPIVELMYNDFLGVCLDPLMNQAAKLPFMTGGGAKMSLVVRTQYGAGHSSAAQHSQSLEGLLASIPGLTVVAPSTPSDAYGLLRSAIDDPNPVIVFEHRHLYGAKGAAFPAGHRVPIGSAAIRRDGCDVTIVSWGRMVHDCLTAAEQVREADDIEAEVIDLRTISPWDVDTVLDSVRRTSRLVIVHEAHGPFGPGAEIAARVADDGIWHLDAPILRIAPPAVPAPYAPTLERAWLPSVDSIAESLRASVSS